MAYNDEAVRAKLSTLNESQESIVTVAQWIMFHRRHADRTATLWLDRLKDSNSNKRLNLLYLANEVVQQQKVRKRDDFLIAFSPLIPEATTIAFRGAHGEVRTKIKRVVEVWRQRSIFDDAIQTAVETRVSEIEKSQSTGKKQLLGGSLFSGSLSSGSSVPAEIKPLVSLQEAVAKCSVDLDGLLSAANEEYDKSHNLQTTVEPPVRVARYNALLKALASAENAVTERIQARTNLLAELQRLVASNNDALEADKTQQDVVSARKIAIEGNRRDTEDAIWRGLGSTDENFNETELEDVRNGTKSVESHEGGRPETEELTPPEVENLTPVGSPENQSVDLEKNVQNGSKSGRSAWGLTETEMSGNGWNTPEPGADLIASLSRPFSSTEMADSESSAKRQRLGTSAEESAPPNESLFPGLSSDVDDLIRAEGGPR